MDDASKWAPGLTATETRDAGHGILYRFMLEDGKIDCFEYEHECLGKRRSDLLPLRPSWGTGWYVDSEEPVTLRPSIHCRSCGLHGFMRAGRWIPC